MAQAAGFWSYTHKDDEQDGGRITRLAAMLQDEYELVSGEELTLFVDRNDIDWGDNWKDVIEQALSGTTFFIPLITPRFFQSSECRRELLRFASEAKSFGLEELLLPILYVDVPALHDPEPDDEAVALVSSTQWEDWTELRLEDEGSSKHRGGVNRLARRLVEIGQRVEAIPTRVKGLQLDEEDADEPGYLELMAQQETLMPELVEIVNSIGVAIEDLGSAANSDEIDELARRNAPMSQRLAAVRRVAERLHEPAESLKTLGSQYASTLIAMNPSILAMFRMLEDGADFDPEDARVFFNGIASMAPASRSTGQSLTGMIESMRPIARWSRDLRGPTKKVEQGLRNVLDGQDILDEWEREAKSWLDKIDADTPESATDDSG